MSRKKTAIPTTWISVPGPADKYVIWIVLVLSAVGVVAVYSAVTFLAETSAGIDTEGFLLRHVLRVGLALGVMVIFSMVDYRKVARYSRITLIGALGLLVAVQFVGVASGGATRWLQIGSFSFQPSEVVKVVLIVYVAVMLARKQGYIKSLERAFLPIFFWILSAVILIGVDDLSTAAMVLAVTVLMCFVARVSIIQLGGLTALGAALAVLLLMGSPNRAARLEAYLGVKLFDNTEAEQVFNPQAEGYQLHQAKIAIAMGGWMGAGPGKSVQRDFLPAPYNDFIFAIIAEEYGTLGALVILGLFGFFLFRGFLRIARHAADPLGLFLGVGLTAMVALYGFVHAAVTCGLVPVTGLPMPLVSYGGTSMLTTGIMTGILLNISRHAT